MYKTPIEITTEEIANKITTENEEMIWNAVVTCLQTIKVDKEELIKALRYDRAQYEKGYKEGYDEGYTNGKEEGKELINRCFQKATDKMKAENDQVEQLLDYAERLQDECKDLKRTNDDLKKCIELQMEASCKCHENIQKAREEIDGFNVKEHFQGTDSYLIGICNGLDKAVEILDKHLGEGKQKLKNI